MSNVKTQTQEDIIIASLAPIIGEYKAELYYECSQTLYLAGHSDIVEQLVSGIIELVEAYNAGDDINYDTPTELHGIIYKHMDQVLGELGISINESIQVGSSIIRALSTVTQTNDLSEQIISICDNEETAQFKIGEICNLITGIDAELVESEITYVTVNFIPALKEVIENINITNKDVALMSKHRMNWISSHSIKYPDTIGGILINHDLIQLFDNVNAIVETAKIPVAKAIHDAMTSVTDTAAHQKLAVEIYTLVLFSNVRDEDIVSIANKLIEKLMGTDANPNTLAKVVETIDELHKGYANNEQDTVPENSTQEKPS